MGLMSACQHEDLPTLAGEGANIYLSASVEDTHASRTPYILTAPTKEKPLKVDVWASTTPYIFKHINGMNGKGEDKIVSLHTTANFTDGKEQLLDAAVYPYQPVSDDENAIPVFFVGMYPQGWVASNEGVQATFTFNGSQDVMFAPQIFGKYAANVDQATWPTFTFKHLLTWLRIQMVAENEDISKAWGRVKGLTIQSSNGVTVSLANHDANYLLTTGAKSVFNMDTDVSFGAEKVPLPFYETGTDNAFNYEIDDQTKGFSLRAPLTSTDNIENFIDEVAYTLCEPVMATEVDEVDKKSYEYTLTVYTANRHDTNNPVTVNLDLMSGEGKPFEGSTMGRQFTILLKFKMGNNISATATVNDWQMGGLGIGDINEND